MEPGLSNARMVGDHDRQVDLEPNCHWANDGERVMGFAITVTNHFNDITVKTPYLTSAMVYLDNFLQPCKDLTTNGSW